MRSVIMPVLGVGLGIVLGIVLAGCQVEEQPLVISGLEVAPVEHHFVEADCPLERCAEVTVEALYFPDAPAFSDELRSRLLTLGQGISEEPVQASDSWEAYAEAFFQQAKAEREFAPVHGASQAVLQASVVERHDDLLIIELNSYVYHAGQAHGLPLTAYMVIDERLGQVVTLDEMLLEGQEEAFQAALFRAHEQWLLEQEADSYFVGFWPPVESRNVAPLAAAWAVTYNVYEIAPYAFGQPTLHIPLSELEGIARPRYLSSSQP